MNRIKELRKLNGLTQADLAKVVNVSDRTIGFYENEERDPDTGTLKILSNYFNVSIDYLLGNDKHYDESKQNHNINARDEKDIAKDIDRIMHKIASKEDGPTYYNDAELSEEDMELFKDALEFALKRIKVKNKEKYTPNKYKK